VSLSWKGIWKNRSDKTDIALNETIFALLITFTFSALVLAQAHANLVLVNGKIWTVDDKRPEVEAVAVLGNRIAAVGSAEEIRKWIGANTKVIDLLDKRVMPGFNDSRRARLFRLFCSP
jgi:hypothetical protein